MKGFALKNKHAFVLSFVLVVLSHFDYGGIWPRNDEDGYFEFISL